jgi:hypothetical protein
MRIGVSTLPRRDHHSAGQSPTPSIFREQTHWGAEMDFCRVSIEAHRFSGTIYVAGLLADLAASRTEELIQGLAGETRVLRVDLRAVDLIDPDAFVRVARILNRWRDLRAGRVTIEFPNRSTRRPGSVRDVVLASPAPRATAGIFEGVAAR